MFGDGDGLGAEDEFAGDRLIIIIIILLFI